MKALSGARRSRELATLRAMIDIHCRARHGLGADPPKRVGPELCEDCKILLDYAAVRLGRCPWGDEKPACSKCAIHCYMPEMRRRIREVMRYAGPRMLYRHPLMGFRHLVQGFRSPPPKG